MNFKRLFTLFFISQMLIINAQMAPIPSSGDKNFNNNISQMPMHDDFLSSTLDLTKWSSQSWSVGKEFYSSNNIIADPSGVTPSGGLGLLRLRLEKLDNLNNNTSSYRSGGISSSHNGAGYNFPYGYYEMNAKLPAGAGLWPSFWLYNQQSWLPCVSDNSYAHEEIDILENPNMNDPNHPEWNIDQYRGYNWWFTYPQDPCSVYVKSGDIASALPAEVLMPGVSTSSTFHKYAVEWFHDNNDKGLLVFYFDGIPQVESLYQNMIPDDNHMEILITNQVSNYIGAGDLPLYYTTDFVLDYVRVYELKKDCGLNITLNSMSDFTNYNYSMKQSVVFNTNCNILVPSGSKETFRASNEIIMKDGFAVDAGAGFTAIVHDCPPARTP